MPVDHGESEPLLGADLDPRDSLDIRTHPDAPIDERVCLEVSDDDDILTGRELKGIAKLWGKVPESLRKGCETAWEWTKGPENPRDFHIVPLFPAIQEAPLQILNKHVPRYRQRAYLFVAYCSLWAFTFALILRRGLVATEVQGWGVPSSLGCGTTYWPGTGQCGKDGDNCRPFSNTGTAFRCPANCASYWALNPRAVGDQEVLYKSLVVGGAPSSGGQGVYRGDSWICPAAIHAGIIDNTHGGCGVVRVVGRETNYIGSKRHGIESVGFDSYFPKSIAFERGVECESRDERWSLMWVSAVFTGVLSLFTASPVVFFFTIFTGVFGHVGLASDPPPHSSLPNLFENLLSKFLPAMFVAWVMYEHMGVRRTLSGLTAQVEKTVLWLGACWIGALSNYTFDFIPIQRLTPHDIQQQPGAKAALGIIICILIILTVKQIWFFRQEGRLHRYGALYLGFIAAILVALVIPNLNLRLHHYVTALLLLPGTSMQTRPALIYQGLLVGLFINGIARWGFASILETALSLQGDAVHNSPLPQLTSVVTTVVANTSIPAIVFRFKAPPGPRYTGISMLVNDVERERLHYETLGTNEVEVQWARDADTEGMNEYFRFGYVEGRRTWDYTKAGVWTKDGGWRNMQTGPSGTSKKLRRKVERTFVA